MEVESSWVVVYRRRDMLDPGDRWYRVRVVIPEDGGMAYGVDKQMERREGWH